MSEAVELVDLTSLQPAAVFAKGGAATVVAEIERVARAVPTDMSTATGRGEIASLARKVSGVKVRLDDMGKEYVSELKARAKVVDVERALLRGRLENLRDEVRQPLTTWEDKEKSRIAEHQDMLGQIETAARFDIPEPTAVQIKERLAWLGSFGGNRDWEEFENRAMVARDTGIEALSAMLDVATRREAERAELDRLRKEAAEREQKERDAAIARRAAEAARLEAEQKAAREAEQAAARERAERERVEREKREAEDRARQAQAEKAAAEERARQAAEKAEAEKAALEACARRAAEAAAAQERQRIADAQAAAEAAQRKREANKRHRAKIDAEAVAALQAAGLSEADAQTVVIEIVRGTIPYVTINY